MGSGETWRRRAGAAAAGVLALAGVAAYLGSAAHARHDPEHALQQLDLLYLDEPAPGLARLGVRPGEPAVVVFCAGCALPELPGVQVVASDDPTLARQYALTDRGRVGPGYALVDAAGSVRYRTFDPGLAEHEQEIRLLVEGLP